MSKTYTQKDFDSLKDQFVSEYKEREREFNERLSNAHASRDSFKREAEKEKHARKVLEGLLFKLISNA